jgi:hypothetical protein
MPAEILSEAEIRGITITVDDHPVAANALTAVAEYRSGQHHDEAFEQTLGDLCQPELAALQATISRLVSRLERPQANA